MIIILLYIPLLVSIPARFCNLLNNESVKKWMRNEVDDMIAVTWQCILPVSVMDDHNKGTHIVSKYFCITKFTAFIKATGNNFHIWGARVIVLVFRTPTHPYLFNFHIWSQYFDLFWSYASDKLHKEKKAIQCIVLLEGARETFVIHS